MESKKTKKQRDKVRKKRVAALRRQVLWLRVSDKVQDMIRKFVKDSKKKYRSIKKQRHENNKYNWK